jgi:hypothetical protein
MPIRLKGTRNTCLMPSVYVQGLSNISDRSISVRKHLDIDTPIAS